MLNLGFHLVAELVGPQKLRLHALHAQPFARVGCIDGLVQQSVDARDQSGRHGSGREHAEPRDIFITGKTRFRDGGHIWKLRRALKARYAKGTQAACVDLLDRARHRRHGDELPNPPVENVKLPGLSRPLLSSSVTDRVGDERATTSEFGVVPIIPTGTRSFMVS